MKQKEKENQEKRKRVEITIPALIEEKPDKFIVTCNLNSVWEVKCL